MMKKRILCLAMALMMMVGTFSTVQAKELVGKDHWKVSFDGSQMTTNFGKDQMNDELSNIQPGDSMTLKVKIENKNSQYTDWYMTNEIIKTLEATDIFISLAIMIGFHRRNNIGRWIKGN